MARSCKPNDVAGKCGHTPGVFIIRMFTRLVIHEFYNKHKYLIHIEKIKKNS